MRCDPCGNAAAARMRCRGVIQRERVARTERHDTGDDEAAEPYVAAARPGGAAARRGPRAPRGQGRQPRPGRAPPAHRPAHAAVRAHARRPRRRPRRRPGAVPLPRAGTTGPRTPSPTCSSRSSGSARPTARCRSCWWATRWAVVPRCGRAGHASVRGVVALAPWLPGPEPVEQLAGRDLVVLHGTRDLTTSPGPRPGSSRARRRRPGASRACRCRGAGTGCCCGRHCGTA